MVMKKPLIVFAATSVIVVGILVWWFSDSQVIKRQTVELADLFTMSSGDGKTSRASKNQNLGELLDEKLTCTIDLDEYHGEHGRDSLLEAHLYLGKACESSSVQASGIEIISLTDNSATVEAEFNILVRTTGGSTYSENSPVTLVWLKNDSGKWQLSKITLEPR